MTGGGGGTEGRGRSQGPESAPIRPGAPLYVASAPGKVLWSGEYAVLDGAPAVVVAVSRRARASVTAVPQRLSPFLAAVRDEIIASYGADSAAAIAAARIVVDTKSLSQDGRKLGIGSSAATTVAAVAVALDRDPRHDVHSPSERRVEIHRIAHRAHAAAQAPRGARGSGADVAASVHGGVLVVQRPDGGDDSTPLGVRPTRLPRGLTPVLIWTGEVADTPSLVAHVRAFAARDPEAHGAARRELAQASRELIAAIDADDAVSAVAAVALGAEALAALGRRARAELVPPSMKPLADLARAHAGAAKPTGAGGGDQILAVFPTAGDAEAFRRSAVSTGAIIVDADVDPAGVQLEPPGISA
jgi:phosphomevalonate kinase